ncbi:TetR/AcrR family transcriptional regulator [Streptomyces sp. ISL-43]|nr:TetR/AcrR family transcriptional regulator [Streptomyces sp. ISL-43]
MTTHSTPRRGPGGNGTRSTPDRRAEILEASLSIFDAIGFGEATVADITRTAGIAKGTFYLYFDSKDHVLGALWEQSVDSLITRAEAVLDDGEQWWRTLDRLLTEVIEHALENAGLRRIVYRSANARALRICRESDERVISLLTAFVTRGSLAGAFQSAGPHWACRMLYRAADAFLHDLISARSPIDARLVTRSVLEAAHRTLGDPLPLPDSPPEHPRPARHPVRHPAREAPPCPDTPCPTSTSASATSTTRRSGTAGSSMPPVSSKAPTTSTGSPSAT